MPHMPYTVEINSKYFNGKTNEDEEYVAELFEDIKFNYNYKGDLREESGCEVEEFDKEDIAIGKDNKKLKSFPCGVILSL